MADQTQGDQRKMHVVQIDELWNIAKARWGDPARRHPAPDKRFEVLRPLLRKVEELLDIPEGPSERAVATARSFKTRKILTAPDTDFDLDDTEEEEDPPDPVPY